MSKALRDYVKRHRGKRFKLQYLGSCTVEDMLAGRLPQRAAHVVVLKDPTQHRVLWVGKTKRSDSRLRPVFSRESPAGRFLRDNAPESLGWRFYFYDAGFCAHPFKFWIIRAARPFLNGYGELPGCYKTDGYLVALMERELRTGPRGSRVVFRWKG